MRLNAAQVAALYALRGTVRRTGELEVGYSPSGILLLARHPDGRVWSIDDFGATTCVLGREAVPGGR